MFYEGNIREDFLQFLNPRDDDDQEIEDCENDVTESTVTGCQKCDINVADTQSQQRKPCRNFN